MLDPLAHLTQYQFDAANRSTVTIDALSFRTTSLFDAAGNLTSLTDAQNNVTTFAYDALNRKSGETDPLGDRTTFSYNPVGALSATVDRLDRRREFAYDAANRLTTEVWFSAAGATVSIATSLYDAAGNLTVAQNSAGTYTMTYDAANRVTVANAPFGVTLTMTYDGVGNRTAVQDSFGKTTTSTYDAANRLLHREVSTTTPVRVDLTYNAAGMLETIQRYANVGGSSGRGLSTYSYDDAGRVQNLHHTDLNGANLANYTYTYDAASRITTEVTDGATKTYTYDDANQLTADGTSTYTFDGTGNRNSGSYTTGTGNRLSNDGVYTYTYDAEGSLTKKSKGLYQETWYYTYDHRNQMTRAEKRSADDGAPSALDLAADYSYDWWGNRTEKLVDADGNGAGGSLTTRFALDGWASRLDPLGRGMSFVGTEGWDVWADLDGSNGLSVRYLRGELIDQVFAEVDSETNWLVTDRQGSTRKVLDAAGALKNTIAYESWGAVSSESDSNWSTRYKYTGRELDTETDLQYSRARYYDARLSRWTSEDPKGFAAGDSNLYRYVKNSTVNLTDPSGLQTRDDIQRLRKQLPNWFVSLDPDHVGQVRFKQWIGHFGEGKAAANAFNDWDVNGDGIITYEEMARRGAKTATPAPGLGSQGAVVANGTAGSSQQQANQPKVGQSNSGPFTTTLGPGHPALLGLSEKAVMLKGVYKPQSIFKLSPEAELVGSLVVPGLGEYLDYEVLTDSKASIFERSLAAGSLFLSGLTLGTSPNAGSFLRSRRAARAADNVPLTSATHAPGRVTPPRHATLEPDLGPGVLPSGRTMESVGNLQGSLTRNGIPRPSPNHTAHHMVPGTLYRDVPMLRDIGFRLDHHTNGIWLERTFHPGRHEAYTRALEDILSGIPRPTTPAARAAAAEQVGDVLDATRTVLNGRNPPLRFSDARLANPNLTHDQFIAQWEAAIRAAMK